jgi:hypothetical protein
MNARDEGGDFENFGTIITRIRVTVENILLKEVWLNWNFGKISEA